MTATLIYTMPGTSYKPLDDCKTNLYYTWYFAKKKLCDCNTNLHYTWYFAKKTFVTATLISHTSKTHRGAMHVRARDASRRVVIVTASDFSSLIVVVHPSAGPDLQPSVIRASVEIRRFSNQPGIFEELLYCFISAKLVSYTSKNDNSKKIGERWLGMLNAHST